MYVAWLLCMLVILGCGVIIVLYGMQFGNKKSLDWLATVCLTAVEDFFLFQPVQVLLIAVFFASTTQVLKNRIKQGYNLQESIKQILITHTPLLNKGTGQSPELEQENAQDVSVETRSQHAGFENLVDPLALKIAREQLAKHRAMTYVLKELLFYTLFAGALVVKVFSARAGWGFSQTKDISELLRLQVRPKFNYTAEKGTVFRKVITLFVVEFS